MDHFGSSLNIDANEDHLVRITDITLQVISLMMKVGIGKRIVKDNKFRYKYLNYKTTQTEWFYFIYSKDFTQKIELRSSTVHLDKLLTIYLKLILRSIKILLYLTILSFFYF